MWSIPEPVETMGAAVADPPIVAEAVGMKAAPTEGRPVVVLRYAAGNPAASHWAEGAVPREVTIEATPAVVEVAGVPTGAAEPANPPK